MTSSLRSSLRSMFRCRGDLVSRPSTCRATFPSRSRGTSTWPRSARLSRSRPQSSESAWRSATQSVPVELARAIRHRDSAARRGHAQPGFGARRRADGRRPAHRRRWLPRRQPASRPRRTTLTTAAPGPGRGQDVVGSDLCRRTDLGSGPSHRRGADLVEEGERASVALERDADEVAQRRLGLALDGGRQPERRDRLDVETLVRLEQLDRVERDPRPVVRRSGTALAQDAAERRDPAEALVRLEHPVAFDAAVHLGPLAELVEQVHLVPARHPPGCHLRVEQLVGAAEERVQRLGGVALLERAVGQLGEVPGGRGGLERIAQGEPGVPDADLGDHVERPAARERHGQLGERLEAPTEPRGRPADALGDRLELADAGRDQGQHAVGLAEVEARQDDGIGRVAARDGHRRDGTTGRDGLRTAANARRHRA